MSRLVKLGKKRQEALSIFTKAARQLGQVVEEYKKEIMSCEGRISYLEGEIEIHRTDILLAETEVKAANETINKIAAIIG